MKNSIYFKVGLLVLSLGFMGLNAQVEDVKIMTYNLLFYKASEAPCTHNRTPAQRDQDFSTIVASVNPDILCVNELGEGVVNPILINNNVLNVNGINHFASANSTNNSSSRIVNMLFYNQDKLTLQSQFSLQRDLNNFPIIRVIDFYRLYLNDAGLGSPGVDTVFFTVAVMHLKAGASTSDQNQRENAAKAVMNYIENNVTDDNIIVTGDFNIRSSNENAYQEFVNYSNATVALNDPINTPGTWHNNSNFATVHTQSTHSSGTGCFSGGGMDDRFDFSLISDAINAGSDNLNYQDYYAYGQDGSSFNGNLNTNSNFSVNASVAAALYNFSDHLPVILELEANVSGIGLNETNYWQQTLQIANPFKRNLELNFKNNTTLQNIEVSVIDLTGRPVLQKNIKTIKPGAQIKFNSATWAPGIYLLSIVKNNKVVETRKLIKRT
jgi:hypothetical protein